MTNILSPGTSQPPARAIPPLTSQMTNESDDARSPPWSPDVLRDLAVKRRGTGDSSYLVVKMPGGYWVPVHHFEEVWILFWRNAPGLKSSRKHQTKALCCDPTRQDRPRGLCIAMGRCIKYFADHGLLPITLANPDKKGGPWKYFVLAKSAGSQIIH